MPHYYNSADGERYWFDTPEEKKQFQPNAVEFQYELDSDGNKYTHKYKDTPELVDGVLTLRPDMSDETMQAQLIQTATTIVDGVVKALIASYNDTHGVAFAGINSIDKWTRNSTYEHYQFACDILDYNEELYTSARSVQAQVLEGTLVTPSSADEFIALLPLYNGVT